MMTFDEYEQQTTPTVTYPQAKDHINVDSGALIEFDLGMIYCALKLSGECGEFTEKLGKIIRDKNGYISQADGVQLQKELGDILWYVARLAVHLGYSLESVAQVNLDKLSSRLERGVLQGSGDDR